MLLWLVFVAEQAGLSVDWLLDQDMFSCKIALIMIMITLIII